MKPSRLELEGFASFRDRTVVDFSGADLFAFTGPTGSGKSSLIDAITFALYGAVARYEKENLVWPVVTQGMPEAKVRFDFTVGEESFTAVRVVRRSAQGRASTRRAVLERNGEVIADSAKEVSREIQKILGLPFSHFIKCVVLPQGDFSRFLHDESSKRQDLLVKLLDLEMYDGMARAAKARAAEHEGEAAWRQRRLEEDLSAANDQARVDAQVRISQLQALAAFIGETAPRQAALARKAAEAAQQAVEARAGAGTLSALVPPEEDLELAERLEKERVAEEAARRRMAEAGERRVAAETASGGHGDMAGIRRLLEEHARTGAMTTELEAARGDLERVAAEAGKLETSLVQASRRLGEREHHLESAGRDHLAARLAETLVAGDRCPICGERIDETPHGTAPVSLEKAREAVDEAKAACRDADDRFREAATRSAALRERVTERERLLAEHLQKFTGEPSQEDLRSRLPAAEAAEAELKAAVAREQEAGAVMTRVGELLATLEDSRGRAWRNFHDTRDPLTPLGAPAVDEQDLAKAWADLVAWARGEAPKLARVAEAAERDETSLATEHRSLVVDIHRACREAGLEDKAEDPAAVCQQALAGARQFLERVEEDLEEAKRLREEEKDHRKRADVAKILARHLGARRFEAWFLHRAVEGLVVVASQLLRELSRGQYSLRLDDKAADFLVVDHANADETRLARTLSGGETFLASLALALALSDHVSRLATGGGARLDAIFLDEGFGTLDEDTLEVVAATIEDLGARGHTVGVVTHVRELAERMPVRFEVSKGPRTSEVRKVVA